MTATHPYIPRVGVVMDFDKTLASDTIDALCAEWGMEREEWEERYEAPLGDGWDGILKRSRALIDCGRDREEPLTIEFFERAAKQLKMYDEVEQLPKRLRAAAREMHGDADVEMVILSSGFAEMIKNSPVAEAFDELWAGTFAFGEDGTATCAKRMISHGMKERYLDSYAKGLDVDQANEPQTSAVERDIDDLHVPFDQLVYVGDGLSDLKAFRFVTEMGGVAIAVDEGHSFDHADQQTPEQRVDDLAPPSYAEGEEMLEVLKLAVRSAAARIAIRARAKGE